MSRHWGVVVGAALLVGPLACGGATEATKGDEGAAGSSSVASGGGGSGPGAGSGGSGGAALPDEAARGGDWGAGILPEALEGCRGPSDVGCEFCYLATGDQGSCTRESGGDREYVDYVGLGEACPADGPRCARCSYEAERSLRALGERDECSCGNDEGTAPCPPNSESCGCFCNRHNALVRACPLLDN